MAILVNLGNLKNVYVNIQLANVHKEQTFKVPDYSKTITETITDDMGEETVTKYDTKEITGSVVNYVIKYYTEKNGTEIKRQEMKGYYDKNSTDTLFVQLYNQLKYQLDYIQDA